MTTRMPVIELDLAALSGADLGLVDALARLALEAKRRGAGTRIVAASTELVELVELVGLADALGLEPRSGGQPLRQPEQREEAGGIEEEGHRRDAVT